MTENLGTGREVFFTAENSQVNYRHMNEARDNEVRTAMKDGIRRRAGMTRVAHLALVAALALLFLGSGGTVAFGATLTAGAGTGTNTTAANGGANSNWAQYSGALTDITSSNNTGVGAYTNASNSSPISHYLDATNFNFSSIPAGATITGIQVMIRRQSNQGGGTQQDLVVQLLKAGNPVGSNLADTATNWPTTWTDKNYGTATEMWGTTWTVADVQNNNFGVRLQVDGSSTTNWTLAEVDYITITVNYSTCTENQTVTLDAIGNPILGATTISATSGGTNIEVSDDNATWHASPWTYTPPANSTGSVTFYARAQGDCATINATPVTVNYDTTCSELTPSSIVWNGTNTAAGDFSGASFVTPTDITGLQFQVTQGNGSGTPATIQSDNWESKTSGGQSFTPNWTDDNSCWYTYNGAQNPSGNVTGSGSMYVYLEGSSSGTGTPNGCSLAANTTYTFEQTTTMDASTYAITFDFWYNNEAADAGDILSLDVWNGSSWDVGVTTIQTGPSPAGGTTASIDLNALGYTSGNIKVRFSYYWSNNGNTWAKDLILDDFVFTGTPRNTETTVIPWTNDPIAASGVLTDGNTYNLYARGTDPECGVNVYYGDTSGANTTADGVAQTFTWTACTESRTLALDALTDPITGSVNVTATQTGGVPDVQVGDSSPPNQASGWTYNPPLDATGSVTFYAQGTGTCATLNDSATYSYNTMVAPTITAFSVPGTVAGTMTVPITTFTASDNVGVTGYLITESATAPSAGAAGWSATAPSTYGVGAYGSYTLYAWAKDAAGNVSLSASATTTVQSCVETGTVTVSISPDPDPANINGPVTVAANLGGGASNGMVRWRENGTAWSAWVASGATYTPTDKSTGTVEFEAMADGNCGVSSPVYSSRLSRTFETRVAALEPTVQSATQNGLTAIRVSMVYCNDLNGNGTFKVEYKLTTEPTVWTTVTNTPTLDGGAGDADGTKNEEVVINIPGLTTGATYDIRMTYIDDTDGVIGTAIYTAQVEIVAWTDNPMLHNSLRFPGTTQHAGDWGTTTGYAGGITCGTCHDKNTGNIKRVKASISFPDGSTMPNGSTNSSVSLLTVEDGTSDLGDDTGGHASSNKICEVCHSSTSYHRYDTSSQSVTTHYNQADCVKCHKHNAGFKADCVSCHANPPVGPGTTGLDTSVGTGSSTAGKHDYHVNTRGYGCNTCHNGWENSGEMPKNGNINIGFNIVLGSTTDTTGNYDGRSTGGGYTAAVGTNVTTGNGLSCSSIYCHGTATPAWTDAGTAVCGSCHGDTNGMPSATPGDGDLSGATSGSQVGKHPEHVINAGLPCSTCHLNRGFGTADHVNGTVDIWFDTAVAGTSATYNPATNTCSNLACHISKVWDSATPASCDMCHGYPPMTDGSANDLHPAGVTPVDHSAANIVGKHSECNTCHGYSLANGATDNTANGGDQYLVSYHRDGKIEMNGISAPDNGQSAQYDSGTNGCAKACHANDAAHQLSSSGLTVQLHEYGSGSCTGCHDGSGAAGTATSISDNSPHAFAATGLKCEECHGSHGGGTIEIPNNTIVGINYTANGEAGIALGVAGTAPGATEAEICWNCHNGVGVSEWGTNNNANGITYNYGTLSGNTASAGGWYSNVTPGSEAGATWSSATFSYKQGAIQSTHSANSAGTSAVSGANYSKTETLDAVANIRCSYCHDVHDLNKLASDNSTGKPYLRGTWKGNPYNEDGAPRSGAAGSWLTVTSGANSGQLPRVNAGANNSTTKGGWWIDQNSNDPNNGETLATTAGLCTLCHGTNVDTMDQTTGENLWVSGGNGHQNAVIGGSGTTAIANNIFSIRKRGSNTVWDDNGSSNYYMSMGGWTPQMARRAYGYRGDQGNIRKNPLMAGEHRYFQGFQWDNPPAGAALIVDDYTMAGNSTTTVAAQTQKQYHTFNCGKCHNPHASRLPKLMITNCLDTKQNTWDETVNSTGVTGAPAPWTGTHLSQWPSAQNCHRLADDHSTLSRGAGWNTVTPW